MGLETVKICSLFLTIVCLVNPQVSFSLTVEESIDLARKNLPSYRASRLRVGAAEALHKAALSPYLPFLDASGARERRDTTTDEYDVGTYNVTLSYILFDGGRRRANRNIAALNLDTDREEVRRNLLDVEWSVKVAFYGVMARKELIEQRQLQLWDAEKNFEVAEGRYGFGVARRSDVLQASVRLEQARFNLREAEGEYLKALSGLNSLIGRSLDHPFDLQGSLDVDVSLPDKEHLYGAALERPQIRQTENTVEISRNNRSLVLSTYYPTFSANLSYNKSETERSASDSSREDKVVGIRATWNLFELGKFYETRAAGVEIDVSRARVEEAKRLALLEVDQSLEDFLTDSRNLTVAQQQLKQAEFNYEQAFGEYKVGRGDILSLVQAETLLSGAREQLILSRLNLIVSKVSLERAASIESLESFRKVTLRN